MNGAIDAIDVTFSGHRACALVVVVIAHAGDAEDAGIVRLDIGAGDHVELILFGDGHERISRGDTRLLQCRRTVSVGQDAQSI